MQRLVEEKGNDVPFPNMAFSRALAAFEERRASSSAEPQKEGGAKDPSEDLLTDAVLLYPLVVSRLMARCAPSPSLHTVEWAETPSCSASFTGWWQNGCKSDSLA